MVTAVSNLCGLAQHRKLLVAVQLLVQTSAPVYVTSEPACRLLAAPELATTLSCGSPPPVKAKSDQNLET